MEYPPLRFSSLIMERFNPTAMVCANGFQGSGCYGDSGGPLFDANRSVLYGITSWGSVACAAKPTVFTRVFTYLDWIRSNAFQPPKKTSSAVADLIPARLPSFFR